MNTTNKPETLCTGCGATVTVQHGFLADSGGSNICPNGTPGNCLHWISALPPVAIAPEPQRTPGPWRYDVQNHQIRTGQPTDRRFSGELIASVSPLNPEMIANARFIVQACNSHDDMLAALKELVRMVGGTLQGYGVLEAPMNAAKTAISKAEDFMEEARRTR